MSGPRTRETSSSHRNGFRRRLDALALALLLACGLRRHEAVALTLDHLQQREEHWAIVDLSGKGATCVPFPSRIGSTTI